MKEEQKRPPHTCDKVVSELIETTKNFVVMKLNTQTLVNQYEVEGLLKVLEKIASQPIPQ